MAPNPKQAQDDRLEDQPVRRVVLADVHNYLAPSKTPARPFETRTARRGDVVEFTQEEIDRVEELDRLHPHPRGKRLGTPEDLAEIEQAESSVSPLEPERLGGMSLEELGAYLTQHPEQGEHVLMLEEARDEPRVPFIDLAQNVASAHEEQVRALRVAAEANG